VTNNPHDQTAGTGDAGPAVSRPTDPPILDVSRETATAVFGDELDRAYTYAELLAGAGVERGLIGPREVPRLWQRHLLNCAVIAELIPRDSDVLDIGSGAGLPGLPLAIARPDIYVSLVEPMERRTTFLTEAVEALGLTNVDVVRARAEDVSPKGKADVVTSRAVAPLGRLAQWSLPLTRPGGLMLAIKGSSAADEVAATAKQLRRLRGTNPRVLRCGTDLLETPTTVIAITRL